MSEFSAWFATASSADKVEGIRQFCAKREPAVALRGGSTHTNNTLSYLVGCGYTDEEIVEGLRAWAARGEPPLSENALYARLSPLRRRWKEVTRESPNCL